MEDKRSFVVIKSSTGFTGGRYVAAVPDTAGKNAGRMVFRKLDNGSGKGAESVVVTIRETTKGSKNKEFSYRVTRTKVRGADAKTKLNFGDDKKDAFIALYTYDVKAV
jgi:hypothetical protein